MPAPLRRTRLYDAHVAAGARTVEFAGWEMPVYYAGPTSPVGAEHRAVRERCGIFDVSHMGEIETFGPQALALLQRLLSNDVEQIGVDVTAAGRSTACCAARTAACSTTCSPIASTPTAI